VIQKSSQLILVQMRQVQTIKPAMVVLVVLTKRSKTSAVINSNFKI